VLVKSLELLRHGLSTQQTLFYYHTRNDKEIDFVCRQSNQVTQLIQVAFDIANSKTLAREVSALIEASDELSCPDLLLLTWDTETLINESNKTIKVIPVWKWLLG
jgi:predicted AAA+ superfamily ATPase